METPFLSSAVLNDTGKLRRQYQIYQEYRTLYNDCVDDYNNAFSAAMMDVSGLELWSIQGKPLQDAIDIAWNNWVSMGNKNEIERLLMNGYKIDF